MKNREEIFLATARTFSENPKIKISFKKEDRKNEEFSLNEININNKKEINRGILDYFSFFERYLESKPFKLYEPKIPNLKILYNYLHHSRAQFLAINEFSNASSTSVLDAKFLSTNIVLSIGVTVLIINN